MVNKRFSITCPFAILLNEISAEIKSHTANQAFKIKKPPCITTLIFENSFCTAACQNFTALF